MSRRLSRLEDLAKEKVAENLGRLAESISDQFSCGDSLESPEKVQLVFKTKLGSWREAVFPGATAHDIQQLVDACSVASFGIDDQQVTDRSYRDAYKLDPDLFTSTFQLSNTPILGEITTTTVPNSHHIRAELYKLNVYAKGGHFKAHVDTPRPNQLFGSLVVCLPTQFSGGQLVTRHHDHKVTFDWSSPPESPKQTLSWAAFFSDVEHEVIPVSEGHRITLTFNLYQDLGVSAGSPVACDVSNSPLYGELRQALANATFLSDGGVLGFASHHAYIFEEFKAANQEELPVMLKGADRVVYLVAKTLGLSVIVKPFVFSDRYCGLLGGGYLVSRFPEFAERDDTYESEPEFEAMVDTLRVPLHSDKYITWCQHLSESQPAGVTVSYGNESRSVNVFYQAAVILVGIPRWDDFRKSFVTACGAAATAPRKKSDPERLLRSSSKAAAKKPKKKPKRSTQALPAKAKSGKAESSSSVLNRFCFHGEMPEIESSEEGEYWDLW